MANRYLLETSSVDGYLTEDGAGVLLQELANTVVQADGAVVGASTVTAPSSTLVAGNGVSAGASTVNASSIMLAACLATSVGSTAITAISGVIAAVNILGAGVSVVTGLSTTIKGTRGFSVGVTGFLPSVFGNGESVFVINRVRVKLQTQRKFSLE